MDDNVLISVIIPASNDETTIRRSIYSCLQQKYVNYEVVIVVNNSSDRTLSICEHIAADHACIHVINNSIAGRSSARNIGIKSARGKYLILLDADDTLEQGRLKRSVKFLDGHPDYVAYCENVQYIDQNMYMIEMKKITSEMFKNILYKNCFPINSITIKNKNLVLFKENIEYNEDWLFWVENLYAKQVFFDNSIGGSVYITGRNTMSNKKKMLEYYLLVRSIINKKYKENFWKSRKSNIALLFRYLSLENRNLYIENILRHSMPEFAIVKVVFCLPLVKKVWQGKLRNEWQAKLY